MIKEKLTIKEELEVSVIEENLKFKQGKLERINAIIKLDKNIPALTRITNFDKDEMTIYTDKINVTKRFERGTNGILVKETIIYDPKIVAYDQINPLMEKIMKTIESRITEIDESESVINVIENTNEYKFFNMEYVKKQIESIKSDLKLSITKIDKGSKTLGCLVDLANNLKDATSMIEILDKHGMKKYISYPPKFNTNGHGYRLTYIIIAINALLLQSTIKNVNSKFFKLDYDLKDNSHVGYKTLVKYIDGFETSTSNKTVYKINDNILKENILLLPKRY